MKQDTTKNETKKLSEMIAISFKNNWKNQLKEMNLIVKQYFQQNDISFQEDILKRLFLQLVLYYQKFQEKSKIYQNTKKHLIATQTIMYEIKAIGRK